MKVCQMARTQPLPPYVESLPDGCLLHIHLQPRASRTAVCGPFDKALKIAVTGPPVEGKANRALCTFLSKRLGVPKSAVQIVKGETSRRKTLLIQDIAPAELVSRL